MCNAMEHRTKQEIKAQDHQVRQMQALGLKERLCALHVAGLNN